MNQRSHLGMAKSITSGAILNKVGNGVFLADFHELQNTLLNNFVLIVAFLVRLVVSSVLIGEKLKFMVDEADYFVVIFCGGGARSGRCGARPPHGRRP